MGGSRPFGNFPKKTSMFGETDVPYLHVKIHTFWENIIANKGTLHAFHRVDKVHIVYVTLAPNPDTM